MEHDESSVSGSLPRHCSGVWCADIPIADLRVGDHCRALVTCKSKPRTFSNFPGKQPRNGTVKEIVGKIVRLECRLGGLVNVLVTDIQKAWGYRNQPNAGAVAPPPQMPDSTNDAPGG